MVEQNTPNTAAEMADPKNLPKDLAAAACLLVLAVASIYIPIINETFIRVIFTVPAVLFIPGYALLSALFPAKKSIDGVERFALSVGLSIAVVPIIGLVLNYTPFGIRLDPVVISVCVFSFAMMIVALYRRTKLSKEERFEVPFEKVKPAVKEEFFPKDQKKADKILSVILIIAICAAVATTIFVIAFPKEGEKYTEFFILGKDKMTADYPERFAAGSTQFVWLGIKNHEFKDMNYTVETILTNTEWNNVTNTSIIHSSKVLDRFNVNLADKEEYLEMYNFTADSKGYNRLEFLLYDENVPDKNVPTEKKIEESYRDLHLWIRVF